MLEIKEFCLFIFVMGLFQNVSKASECIARGRYPNNEYKDCRGYTICLIGGSANFTEYKLICPKGFIYSHRDKQCTNVTGYYCLPTYNCTYIGNFENPESENCTSYIACFEGIEELATARLVQCPPNKVFSPIAEECVKESEYKCIFKIVDEATLQEIDDGLSKYYNSISISRVEKLSVKSTVALCIMTILIVLQ